MKAATILVSTLTCMALLGGCGDGGTTPAASTTTVPSTNQSSASPSVTVSPSTPADSSAVTLESAMPLANRDAFPILAPRRLPNGWDVAAADYGVEGRGTWKLDLTDARGTEYGVRQSLPDVPAKYVGDIATYMGSGAVATGKLHLGQLGGAWDRYDGIRFPRILAAGRVGTTNVVLWADDAAALARFAAILQAD